MLGESQKHYPVRTFGWAMRQLRRGCFVARHDFDLEEHPKRLCYRLETVGTLERLVCSFEPSRTKIADELVARFTWRDVCGRDWYVVEQLECAR